MNGLPTVPVAVSELLITGLRSAVPLIIMESVANPVPLALMALMVPMTVPAAVGVPESRPVDGLTLSHAGNPFAA